MAVAGAGVSSLSIVAVLSPVVGGTVTGFLARGGRIAGSVLGGVVGLTVAVVAVGGFVYLVVTAPPTTGGAGVGIVVLFLGVCVFGVLAVLFAALGGLFGAAIRGELDRSRQRSTGAEPVAPRGPGARAPTASADSTVEDHVAVDRIDENHADGERTDEDHADAGPADHDRAAVDPGVEDHVAASSDRRPSLTNVLIGAGLSVVVFFVPGSPLLGGGAVGLLERRGWRRGALLGALAGVVATLLALLVVFLVSIPAFFLLLGAFFDLLPWLTVLFGAYFGVLSTVGGAIGGAISSSE